MAEHNRPAPSRWGDPVSTPHATYRLPDGETVPVPQRPASRPVTRRDLVYGWIAALLVLAVMVAGIAGVTR